MCRSEPCRSVIHQTLFSLSLLLRILACSPSAFLSLKNGASQLQGSYVFISDFFYLLGILQSPRQTRKSYQGPLSVAASTEDLDERLVVRLGSGPHWFPGRRHASSRRVYGRYEPDNHPECEGARPGGGYSCAA